MKKHLTFKGIKGYHILRIDCLSTEVSYSYIQRIRKLILGGFLLWIISSGLIGCKSNEEPSPLLTADFNFSPQNPNVGDLVYFTPTADQAPYYSWSSPANFSSSDKNPYFIFSQPGTFEINLKVTNAIGNSLACHATITVKEQQDPSAKAPIDAGIISFMNKYKVPGLSLAITKDGRLVYKKGYGATDIATQHHATAENLFRIASISKTITSVTIMKLIEDGKLALEDKVFGMGSVLGTQYGTLPYNTYVKDITVKNLLEHTGGGWGNAKNDPMFLFNTIDYSQKELISYTIDKVPLDNKPGSVYNYSNFGYCILGRIIEKITNTPYEQYVKENIFKPIGINNAFIAGNTFEEKRQEEVTYYSQENLTPYSKEVSAKRLDACAGWIISPIDMCKFLLSVDGFPGKPDILKPSSILTMTTPSSANAYYALGWSVDPYGNYSHSGSMIGTATIAIRMKNGFCLTAFANTRSLDKKFVVDMNNIIWNIGITSNNIQWIDGDLF